MSMTMKRNWYLMVIAILFLFVLCYFGTKRVISINIWNKWGITTDYFDIDNTINLFDTTQAHEIKILMTQEEYQDMIDTYINTFDKNRYKTDIVIDWVTIHGVWIRLKWNSSLRRIWRKNWRWANGSGINNWKTWISWFNFSWNRKINWIFEWNNWRWTKNDDNYKLPLLIKFNKYDNQSYQWHTMITLRVWWTLRSDITLLAEPYSYELYQKLWQPAPDTSYWVVEIAWWTRTLFLISELIEDKYYLQKWFLNDDWILYKAWNFVDFSYKWEDPTLYSKYFEQKTKLNDYDFAPLIRMLKFISESTDNEFEQKINNYIDVESVLTLLAIDSFVWNNDSFGGMWSNYYLYYDLWEQRFYILTWDQNLAFGWMWDGLVWGWLLWIWWANGWKWFTWNNILKTRLLKNEKFQLMYDKIYEKVKEIALNSDFSENFFNEWTKSFYDINGNNELISNTSYSQWIKKLKNYLKNKK